ncbi:MAG: hypothetical protein NC311_06455 [Muribaculaceae bacterium]|nr:hypothetical protein [Muribaculaceae bacterium]
MKDTLRPLNNAISSLGEILGYTGVRNFQGVVGSLCRDRESYNIMFERESKCYDRKVTQAEMQKIIAFIGKTYSNTYTRVVELYDKYNAALISKGIIQDYADADSLDFIDASKFYDLNEDTDDPEMDALAEKVKTYGNATGFFGIIPPFTTACIRLCHKLDVIYNVIELDRAKRSIKMKVTAYDDCSKFGCKSKVPVISFTLGITAENIHGDGKFTLDIIEPLSITEMYRAISPKQMKWNKTDRIAWSQVYLRLIRMLEGEKEQMSVRCIGDISTRLISAITGINYALTQNKTSSSAPAYTPGPTAAVNAYNPEAQAERQVRVLHMVGPVAIKSASLPVVRDEERVINYQVAAWSVRGHMRHYKNGKCVYIKPRVNHRQCMGDLAHNVTPRPQTLTV